MRAVNLIPAEERRGASVGVGRSQGAAYAVFVLMAGMALFAFLYGTAHHQIASRRAQVVSLTAQTQRAEEAANQLTPYTSFMALREQRMQAVAQLVNSRFDWAHAIHELGRVLPKEASISSLDGTVGAASAPATTAAAPAAGAAATPASAGGSVSSSTPPGSVPTFTLAGCATSQSQVALTLQRLRLMDGVQSVSLQSSTVSSSSGAGASSSEGPCGAGKPTFTIQITYDPLPTVPVTGAATVKVASTTGAGQ